MYSFDFAIQVVRHANRNTIYSARKKYGLDHKTIKRWIDISKKRGKTQTENLKTYFKRKDKPIVKRLTQSEFKTFYNSLRSYQHIYIFTFEIDFKIGNKKIRYATIAHDFKSKFLNLSFSSNKATLNSIFSLEHIKQYLDQKKVKRYNFIFESGKVISSYRCKKIDKFKWIVRNRLEKIYNSLHQFLVEESVTFNDTYKFLATNYLYLLKTKSPPEAMPILIDEKGSTIGDIKSSKQLVTLSEKEKNYIRELVGKSADNLITSEEVQQFKDYRKLLYSHEIKLKIGVDRKSSLLEKSYLLKNLGEIPKAESSYKEWLKIFKDDDEKKVELLIDYGLLLHSNSRNTEAIKKFKNAAKIAKKNCYYSHLLNAYFYLFTIYNYFRDNKRNIFYLKKLNPLVKKVKDYNSFKKLLSAKGNYYFANGKFDKALVEYKTLLQHAKNNKDIKTESLSLVNIGKIYSHQKKFKLALNNYLQNLVIKKQLGHKQNLINGYLYVATGYYSLNKLEKALMNIDEALKDAEKIGNKTILLQIFLLKCKILTKKEEYREAIKYWIKAYLFIDQTTKPFYKVLQIDIKRILSKLSNQ